MTALVRFHNRFHLRLHPRCYARGLIASGLLVLLLALTSVSIHAQDHYPQRTDRFVNDYARLLNTADAAALQTLCADLLRNRGVELVVVTIDSIGDYDTPDRTIEAFATNLFNTWGIGDRRRNDGVLLLVAVKDRKVRIEVGSGYGDRYNATMQQVIDQDIVPSFRRSNYSQGIAEGARAIVAALAAPQPAVSSPPQSVPQPVPTVRPANSAPISVAPVASKLESTPIPGALPTSVLVGGLAALVAAGLGAWRYIGTRPRRCPHCRVAMVRVAKVSKDQYLDPGRQLEQELGSVDYTVWCCAQCDACRLEKSERWFSPFNYCVQCGYRTLRTSKQTLQHATYSATGLEAVTGDCEQCGYHHVATKVLPMLTRSESSSSDSSSSFSSSSSSFSDSSSSSGGGSSSGDGASGSW